MVCIGGFCFKRVFFLGFNCVKEYENYYLGIYKGFRFFLEILFVCVI